METLSLERESAGLNSRQRSSLNRRYATICVTMSPEDVPRLFLKKVLSICASKLGSRNIDLASHVMVVLNVCFKQRAGRLSPEVLLVKTPLCSASCAGEAKASEHK